MEKTKSKYRACKRDTKTHKNKSTTNKRQKIKKEKPLPPITEEQIPFELPKVGFGVECKTT